jgi:hypothetical protein
VSFLIFYSLFLSHVWSCVTLSRFMDEVHVQLMLFCQQLWWTLNDQWKEQHGFCFAVFFVIANRSLMCKELTFFWVYWASWLLMAVFVKGYESTIGHVVAIATRSLVLLLVMEVLPLFHARCRMSAAFIGYCSMLRIMLYEGYMPGLGSNHGPRPKSLRCWKA